MRPQLQGARAQVTGVLLIVVMAACFATMDTTIKVLGAWLPVLLMLWLRYAFQALAMLGWLAWQRGREGFRTAHPRFQLLRGLLLLATSAMSFFSVQFLPVAEYTAITMLTPVIVTLFSGWLLHEPVSRPRWALVIGGFIGALIIIRPGSGLFGWAVLMPLAGACAYAAFQLLTRRLAGVEDPFSTHFYTGLTGTLLLTAVLAASPIDVMGTLAAQPASRLALMTMVGALGTAGHLFLILALGMGRPATLMPFMYSQIAFATGVAYVWLGAAPDAISVAGMAVIGACGAASVWLNFREAEQHSRVAALTADTISD
ncbi:DMT family transporter [Ideonella sp. BN130291]|uniref:DMT family transporter n=1 Tax=Ideonella sp. BN130291 TaxID=3112940 RepID=UPI002E25E3DF|nr:DMT family transporter [Ideonella sp. BN130291]